MKRFWKGKTAPRVLACLLFLFFVVMVALRLVIQNEPQVWISGERIGEMLASVSPSGEIVGVVMEDEAKGSIVKRKFGVRLSPPFVYRYDSYSWDPSVPRPVVGKAPQSNRAWFAKLLDRKTGRIKASLQSPSLDLDRLMRLVFSPDGKTVAAVYAIYGEDRKQAVGSYMLQKRFATWSVPSGKLLWKAPYATPKENLSAISLAWTPDGKRLVVDGDELRLFDAKDGHYLRTLAKASYQRCYARLSPNGGRLVTTGEGTPKPNGAYSAPSRGIVRDFDGRVLAQLPGQTLEAFWSSDGKILVQVTPKSVDGWNASAQRRIWSLPTAGRYGVVLSRDGSKIALIANQQKTGCKGGFRLCIDTSTVEMWEVATQRHFWSRRVEGYLRLIRFSFDGARLSGVVEDTTQPLLFSDADKLKNKLYVWDATSGDSQREETWGGQFPEALWFPDNSRLLLQSTGSLTMVPLHK